MNREVKSYIIILFVLLGIPDVYGQRGSYPAKSDPGPLHKAQHALTSVIVHDIFSPPVSSRIYAYAHISAYEILVQNDTSYRSLQGQIKDFPVIPKAVPGVATELAAVYAFLLTGKQLIFSEKMLEDTIQQIIAPYKRAVSKKSFAESLKYAKEVSSKIVSWANQDKYNETRKLTRYNLRRGEGKWVPTPPVYMTAIEPNWKLIRPFVLDSAAQFKPLPPPVFSRDKDSPFYKIAHHVYTTCNEMSDEQKAIANFWDCNPFAVNVHGHINYATKKLSPGGHWLSIAGIAARKEGADIVRTSAAYTMTAITLFDAFISCWDEKFRSDLVRPESYINAYIDEKWKPMLQTPPFPEYTSGHSVISTASAMVLSKFFGDQFSFTDTSEVEYGLPARNFNSFTDACNEAAISRLYGGIHYLPAIEEGQIQGRKVGELVLQRLALTHQGAHP